MAKKVVFGLARNIDQANRIIDQLQVSGINTQEISVLVPDREKRLEFKDQTPRFYNESEIRTMLKNRSSESPKGSKSPAGGLFTGTITTLRGLGAIYVPGFGAVLVAGPIVTMLNNLGSGGALGLLAAPFINFGIPENEVKKYETELKKGSVLVIAHVSDPSQIDQVKDIYTQEGVTNIAASRETAGTAGSW